MSLLLWQLGHILESRLRPLGRSLQSRLLNYVELPFLGSLILSILEPAAVTLPRDGGSNALLSGSVTALFGALGTVIDRDIALGVLLVLDLDQLLLAQLGIHVDDAPLSDFGEDGRLLRN